MYVVIFRTGGPQRFAWHRSLQMSCHEAQKACISPRRMGYEAFVAPFDTELPDTYVKPPGVGLEAERRPA